MTKALVILITAWVITCQLFKCSSYDKIEVQMKIVVVKVEVTNKFKFDELIWII